MDIGSIFFILALLIPVILFVLRPIIERSPVQAIPAESNLSSLQAERDHIVASIKELDDDYGLGKIPAEEYPTQRQTLLNNGAVILRMIDDFQSSSSNQAPESRLEATMLIHRQSSEAELAPKKNGNAVPPVPDDDLEQKIASRRRLMQGKAGGFCPKCGHPIQATDRFCPHCGATVA
jgi:zinc-ribbon domain